MLDSFPVALCVGALLGLLSGLGIGGGSLLILWLTLVLDTDMDVARGINLMFFIPSAVISSLFRCRQGKLSIKTAFPALLAGVLGAILLSSIGSNLNTEVLKKPFGILLLVTGVRELCYRLRKDR